MKILIKGAGDLASGIACRLHRCGFSVVMTELPVPTTVRRTVAFSRAVYENSVEVENVTGVLCTSMEDIEKTWSKDQVAVVIDEECRIRKELNPDAVVDAIIAKKNLGTRIKDADIVIGVGPGFTAGVDCHAVVETKRGHDLGRCIWKGSAFPNSGVPGIIGGYDKERIIRAVKNGIFHPAVTIGTVVKQNDVVGYVDDLSVLAEVGGVVRGLLQDGVTVFSGMKSGDIDPRGVTQYCYTISDKASAIGGGVLEAVLSLRKKSFTEKERVSQ
ncbi:selenium-dependent molybdenum cofactor biosynthesis protein YqeB [Clostridium boliviensis]|uniref:Selenium-dependent molybdenum cofactor biosynthesis protein YqeB n=1 Tax=Clostridium boliviensis TaxID=318465 RepID=A0ABU4GEB2_9CLOT|nr:selenium-dependent molybdenum cofactor biosynthesis protein YqeB [Clostridium boliviensis]MDW2795971.1 selenium-dependent molybdenum cofactor biosynthesis protein YqeB [Clostridium boliviensis]